MPKNILIVGGSSGLGKRLAELYVRDGCKVGIIARREALLKEIQQQFPSNVYICPADICDNSITEKINNIIHEMNGVDIIILSASTGEIMRAAFLVRLSEGETVAAMRGAVPLYALDDFDAELSPGAAESLLAHLPEEAQVALTSAHPDAAARCPRRPEAIFEVMDGNARPSAARENLRRIG